ncbi:MAG TPA: hypothetical protein VFK02_29070 [Kofleriaceae bacterium]|nr:hypothetical protein [Kofleriaceae bacterium]
MRRSCALIAGLLAGRAACLPGARAEDVRDTFGLGPRPPPATASCGDGLASGCAIATDPLDAATPYALSTWLAGSYLARLPIGDATHDQLAAFALGASQDEAGPVFGGASGLENRWTIDGAPADSVRTGAADARIPVAFLDGILVSAGGFSARDRASTGGTIDARLRRGTPHHEVSADVWTHVTLASRDRPHATGSYDVRRLTTDAGPGITASLVATGPLPVPGALGGTAWYAAGIAPGLSSTDRRWRASRIADADADGVPDGLPGEIAVLPIETRRARTLDYLVPAMARVGLDRDAQHLELSLIGYAARDARFLGNATLPAAGIDRSTQVGDAIATWRGSWAQSHARVQLAWHHSARRDSAHDPAAAHRPQLLTAYVPEPLADDPTLATACDDSSPDDPTPRVANCPVPLGLFASGGAGLLTHAIGDRPTATADLAHQMGDHVLRAGATFEDTRLVTTSSFTGAEQQFSLFPGELSRRRFYVGDCADEPAGAPCDYASSSQRTYRTVYAAAYAEDTFSPQRGLSIDGGLRWELMWVGTQLRFSHELAPRVGIAWDVLGDGRSRVWASLGKTFAMLPAGLGQTVIQRDATVDDFELGGLVSRRHDTGAAIRVVPGVEPIEQDEVTFGGELALVGALRATAWGQGRFIRRGLETTRDGFDDPGRNGDIPATRQSELVAFALEMAQRERTMIRAGVSWGRVDGTWTGPNDPRQGANLLAGPDWDVDASNLFGPLPTSPGGRVFIEAERRGRLGPVDAWVATRLEAGSGRPRNVLAGGPTGTVELLPRGALGPGPVLARTDLRLAARWRGVTATLDLENLFDRREPTNLDEVYTADDVRPVEGGSYADLVFLKTTAGTPATRRTGFQLPTAFQDPLAITLGVHYAF